MTTNKVRLALASVIVLAGVQSGAAQQAAPAAPPKPAPRGTSATVLSAAELAAALKKSTDATPNMSEAPIQNSDQYRINIVRRGQAAGAIAHTLGTELHYIIDGGGTLVTGGTIVRPAAGTTDVAKIEGGATRKVSKGDVVLIPENTPHWYSTVDGSITYLEVRFNVPTK